MSYQVEKAAVKGTVGFFGLLMYAMLIGLVIVAAAGLIVAVLAVMILVSLLSVGVALWRRHVLHLPGTIEQLRPPAMKPTQWGGKRKQTTRAVAPPPRVPALPVPQPRAPALPAPPTDEFPKRVTQAWINENVPEMSPDDLGRFMSELRKRGWTDGDMATRVIPHAHATVSAGAPAD